MLAITSSNLRGLLMDVFDCNQDSFSGNQNASNGNKTLSLIIKRFDFQLNAPTVFLRIWHFSDKLTIKSHDLTVGMIKLPRSLV